MDNVVFYIVKMLHPEEVQDTIKPTAFEKHTPPPPKLYALIDYILSWPPHFSYLLCYCYAVVITMLTSTRHMVLCQVTQEIGAGKVSFLQKQVKHCILSHLPLCAS